MICLATPKKIEKCFDHYFTRIWPCLFFWGTISIFQPQQVLRMHFGTPLCSVENWMDLTWFHQGNDRHNQSHPSIPTGSHGIVNNSWPGHNCGSQLFFLFFSGYAYRLVPALDSKTDDFNPGLNMDMDPVRYVSPQTHPFRGKFRNGFVLEGAQIPLLMS